VKQATKSPKKAFIVTLLPWIITVIAILGGLTVGIIGNNLNIASNSYS
jgi:flagellar biosynthesis component FlhA